MADNPEKSSKTHPDKDRRLRARQRIHSLSYVKMGDSNGGIVLNISDGGISVQAAAALDPSEPVTLSLEIPRVRNRVEVKGEIAWLSPSKKEAGIRFIDLPESTLKQIQKWMEREASPEQFEDETDPVGEPQEVPVAAAAVKAAVESAPMEATAEAEEKVAGIEAAPDEDGGVRELNEANILSADEIKKLASEPNAVHRTTVAVSEKEVQEIEEDSDTEDQETTVEATANFDVDEAEEEEAVEEEAEVEQLAAQNAKASAELKGVQEKGTKPETRDADEAEEEEENEDGLIQAFGPPVVPFERRPNTPFSSMNALAGGARSAQNLAIAPSLLHDVRTPFVESAVAAQEAAPESGWKVFRIQLQTGWFLAALVLLLALISFIAGMAVRRGALNGVMGEQQDMLIPRSATASGAIAHIPATASGTTDGTNAAEAAKPLSIEIVDLANHRWVIPASTGANRSNVTPPAETSENSASGAAANASPSQGSSAGQAVTNAGTTSAAGSGKGGVPLVLSLPETPISATGSVAISSQRSVPVPADGSKAAQNGRNLQVGQLVNLVEPVYPAEAVQQKIEGTVKLHAVIGTDGAIESLAQVSGPQVLVNASMAAVRNWKYSPTRMNGQSIETQEDISFVFRLPN